MNVLCRTMMSIEAGGSPETNEQGKEGAQYDGNHLHAIAADRMIRHRFPWGLTDTGGPGTILNPAGVLVPKGAG